MEPRQMSVLSRHGGARRRWTGTIALALAMLGAAIAAPSACVNGEQNQFTSSSSGGGASGPAGSSGSGGNGGHGGGLTARGGIPFGTWTDRYVDWFKDLGFLRKPGTPTKAAVDVEAFAKKAGR